MALTITTQPSSVSFAGNPILVQAHTDLVGKTFLRIIADVSVMATNRLGAFSHKESFTYSVAENGDASFNLSETVQAAIRSRSDYSMRGGVSQAVAKATYSVVLKEVYLDNMIEVVGDTQSLTNLVAVSGLLTDYERVLHPSWGAASFIGSGVALTRKPEDEIVYGGQPVYFPVATSSDATLSVAVTRMPGSKATNAGASKVLSAYVPDSLVIPTSALTEGLYEFSLSPSARSFATRKFIRKASAGQHLSFLFINSFGALESITALTGRVDGFNLQRDHYTEVPSVQQEISDIVNLGATARATLQATTGHITYAWADWFASEFFTARKVWMLIGNEYLPVAIESEDNLKLRDTSRPDLCEVSFTIRCSFKGSTLSVVR